MSLVRGGSQLALADGDMLYDARMETQQSPWPAEHGMAVDNMDGNVGAGTCVQMVVFHVRCSAVYGCVWLWPCVALLGRVWLGDVLRRAVAGV